MKSESPDLWSGLLSLYGAAEVSDLFYRTFIVRKQHRMKAQGGGSSNISGAIIHKHRLLRFY